MELAFATPGDIRSVAEAMRERDLAEFSAVLPYDTRAEIAEWLVLNYQARPGILAAGLEGVPICIGGPVHLRPGSVALLFLATERFEEIVIPMTRFLRRQLFPKLHTAGTHRIECMTLATYAEMHRWLEMLGLRREGECAAYGKRRETFFHYARVR